MKKNLSKDEQKIEEAFKQLKAEESQQIPAYKLFREQLDDKMSTVPVKTKSGSLRKIGLYSGVSVAAMLLLFIGLRLWTIKHHEEPLFPQNAVVLITWQSPTEELLAFNTQKNPEQLFQTKQTVDEPLFENKPQQGKKNESLFGDKLDNWQSPTDDFLK
ncbi:hypothetical protein BKI52_31800 [marine bacterium AO1-C]|nr:hypothetical protein BKI52_31800 [marine bacterium AO1-C]